MSMPHKKDARLTFVNGLLFFQGFKRYIGSKAINFFMLKSTDLEIHFDCQ